METFVNMNIDLFQRLAGIKQVNLPNIVKKARANEMKMLAVARLQHPANLLLILFFRSILNLCILLHFL